jgi:pimeloyl-ACP methyl ester carboxylesterase
LGGGGWELFSESPYDMAAWVTFAAGLVERGVLLAGHSLGALKVGYYQAQRNDPRVRGVAACSPPGGASRLDPALLAQAERMVAEGRGQDLLPWGSRPTGAGTHSAQTYLDRAKTSLDVYGVNGSMRHVSQIRCPLFVCLGTEEPTVGTAEDLETIRRKAANASRVETRLFQGADHSYAGHEEEVAQTLATWASSLA